MKTQIACGLPTIGSGSVVTKDIPANVIAVGNPCKVRRKIIYKYINDFLKMLHDE